MQTGLILPSLVLAAVVLSGPLLLFLDVRRRKLTRQVELVAATTVGQETAPVLARSIRLAQTRNDRLRELLYTLLRYDKQAQTMRVMPVPVVFAVATIAAFAAGIVASLTFPKPICIVVSLAAGIMAVRGIFGWHRDRFTNALTRQIPDMIELVVSAVRAGLPASEAFRGVAREMPEPTRAQFVSVAQEIAGGRPLEEALLNIYHRTKVTEYAIFAVTVAVQAKSGGRLAETIQNLAETVRQRIALAGKARALAGEARVSAMVLAALPVVCAVALSLLRPGYLDPLLEDPRGKRLFVIGVGSLLAGIWTMRQMINRGTQE